MKIKNNINKNIGKVVYIVEGDNDEPKLIIDIFQKIFNYSIVRYDKLNDKIVELKQDNNKYSKVYIIPAKYSAISTLDINDDYFDEIFSKLSKYDLDIDNSALYFLFDRDRQSNRPGVIKKNMSHFYNSRDNGEYRNGLFLLSYPSIESFYLNCFNDDTEFGSGTEIKGYPINKDIEANNINDGTCNILNIINAINKDEFNINMLDSFKDTNLNIFNYQECKFNKDKKYITLSLLFLSLIDLGLIEIDES